VRERLIDDTMRKVIVIGLDAVCLDMITPWLNQGKLPYLQKLLNKGTYSELESVIPPMTAPAWTSMVTGKRPEKHRLFDFLKYKPGSYEKELVSALDCQASRLWDYLTDHNKSSIVITVPLTYPARAIRGVLIPGHPLSGGQGSFPPGILQEFQGVFGECEFNPSFAKGLSARQKLQKAMDATRAVKEAALYFSQQYDWDFLMVQFQMTDAIAHLFGLGKQTLQLFQFVDRCVDEIVAGIGKDANIFLVSDHGMGPAKWHLFLNSFLREEGYLKAADVGKRHRLPKEVAHTTSPGKLLGAMDKILGFLAKHGMTAEEYYRLLSKLRLTFLKGLVPKAVLARVPRKVIDWEETRAYCPSSTIFGIRVNVKGREPDGTVAPGQEYDVLRGQLIQQLRELRAPDGELVFEKVFAREGYYQGSEADQAPDIMFLPNQMDYVPSDVLMPRVFAPYTWYNHKVDGVLAAHGPDIRNSGYLNCKFSILDVAPTILHICGLPVPKDMDGRVLNEILREDSEPGQREIEYQEVDYEAERVRTRIRGLRKLGRL